MSQQIHIEQRGRVLLATLDNPPHALMGAGMVAELDQLVGHASDDDSIGAVVLTGAHPERFIAHYDVRELLALARSAPSLPESLAKTSIGAIGALERIPGSGSLLERTPAAGLSQLRGFHDTDDGLIGQPEILLGIPPGGGGTQRLARLIGRGRALELVLEGRPVPEDEAVRIGVVHRVLPRARLLDEALATAERLARRSKPVVAACKRAVLEGGNLPLEMGLKMEQAAFVSSLGHKSTQRAMEAYIAEMQSSGDVAAANPEMRGRLVDGTFIDFNTP